MSTAPQVPALVELERGRAICRVERTYDAALCEVGKSRGCAGIGCEESYIRVHAFTPAPTSVAVCVACARLLPVRAALVRVAVERNEAAARYAGARLDPAGDHT